jgi:hypothetical protein
MLELLQWVLIASFTGNGCKKLLKDLSPQEIGIAKLSGFGEWFSNQCVTRKVPESDADLDMQYGLQKTIIFGHHLKVLDGIQVAFILVTLANLLSDFC